MTLRPIPVARQPMQGDDENPVIPPPCTASVDFDRRPILYDADGRALVRRVGFRPPETQERRRG